MLASIDSKNNSISFKNTPAPVESGSVIVNVCATGSVHLISSVDLSNVVRLTALLAELTSLVTNLGTLVAIIVF